MENIGYTMLEITDKKAYGTHSVIPHEASTTLPSGYMPKLFDHLYCIATA